MVILKGGSVIKMPSVKLNFYTNEVHYIDKNGTELVAQAGQVKKVIMFSNQDSAKATAVFYSLSGKAPDKTEAYYQVLNDGKTQLLKKTTVTLRKKDYDPSIGKAEYKFVSDTDYFIKDEGGLNPIKSLSKSSLFSVVKPVEATEDWLSTNKNKLKSEEDILAYLGFINSTQK